MQSQAVREDSWLLELFSYSFLTVEQTPQSCWDLCCSGLPPSLQFGLICVLSCPGSAYPDGGQGSPRAASGLRGLSLGQWQASFSLSQTGEALQS